MNKNDYKLAMDASVQKIQVCGLAKPKALGPRDNLEWIKLKQRYRTDQENLQSALFAVRVAESAVSAAESSKKAIIKSTNETRAQLELLAEKLGIDMEDEDSNE